MAKKTTTQKHMTVLHRMVQDILLLKALTSAQAYRITALERRYPESGSAALKKLDQILAQMERLMSKADDMNAKLDDIDAKTTEIGNDIDTLLARPGGLEGLTAEEADAITARLSAHADTLRGIAAKS